MSIYSDAKSAVLEKMDIELFLDHLDPDYKNHYNPDLSIAFDQITENMSLEAIDAAIKESGCMDDYTPVHLRNQAE